MSLPAHERYQKKESLGSSHAWACEFCASLPSSSAVLDIGPGSGFMGEYLRGLGWTNLWAVETDPEARAHVAPLYHKVETCIEPFSESRFDLILLLDVLEHLPNPEAFFRSLVPLLNPGAQVLISVPNITHWSVRAMMLLGRFEYYERGILDRTHLQFFSRRRLESLARLGPFDVVETGASIAPYELALPSWVSHNCAWRSLSRLRLRTARMFPALLGYQHLMAIRMR